MKVVHIINSMERGGAEMRVLDLVNYREGPDTSLVCLRAGGALEQEITNSGVSVLALRADDNWSHMVRQLDSLLRRMKPDLVHTHLVHSGIIGRLAARAAGIPVISTQHNAFHSKQDSFFYRLERGIWPLSAGFIALSAAIRSYLRSHDYSGPVKVIRTGIDSDDYERQAVDCQVLLESPTILSVGQFRDGQKGHDVLIKAFSWIAPKFPTAKLCIVGDGVERDHIRLLVKSYGLAGRITLMGERSDVPGLMKQSSIFVLASRWEGLGRVILEAMALGCAIVASRVEGIPEMLVHGSTGLLVAPDSPIELSQSVSLLLRDQGLRRTLGENASRAVRKRFTLKRMCESEFAFYARVLTGGRRVGSDEAH